MKLSLASIPVKQSNNEQFHISTTTYPSIEEIFSYCILEVAGKEERRTLKSKLASTLSVCQKCEPSSHWLGLDSPNYKIRESGLWQIQGLYKQQLTTEEMNRLVNLAHD